MAGADFFISYTGADVSWARWVDWVLRSHGHTTRVQLYDFRAGESFVGRIHDELRTCRRVLCLLSEAYLRSRWCDEEWQGALHGEKLVPLRIAQCMPEGLLASRIYVDLVGL